MPPFYLSVIVYSHWRNGTHCWRMLLRHGGTLRAWTMLDCTLLLLMSSCPCCSHSFLYCPGSGFIPFRGRYDRVVGEWADLHARALNELSAILAPPQDLPPPLPAEDSGTIFLVHAQLFRAARVFKITIVVNLNCRFQ
jgi:tRNA(Arg) A34 adenosine deaminase TadA